MSDKNYDDIINLPHYVSTSRTHISMHDRAAQFSPFAALTGYYAEIEETARLTGEKQELDEYRATRIDTCLQILIDNADERPSVSVTYFLADEKKSGGAYITVNGRFRRLDEEEHAILLMSGEKIPLEDIYSLDGAIFAIIGE